MIALTVAEADVKYIEIIDFAAACDCLSPVTEYFELSKWRGGGGGEKKRKRCICDRNRGKEEK